MKRKFLKCMLLLAICSIFMSACSKPTKESIQTVSKYASQGENTSSTAIAVSVESGRYRTNYFSSNRLSIVSSAVADEGVAYLWGCNFKNEIETNWIIKYNQDKTSEEYQLSLTDGGYITALDVSAGEVYYLERVDKEDGAAEWFLHTLQGSQSIAWATEINNLENLKILKKTAYMTDGEKLYACSLENVDILNTASAETDITKILCKDDATIITFCEDTGSYYRLEDDEKKLTKMGSLPLLFQNSKLVSGKNSDYDCLVVGQTALFGWNIGENTATQIISFDTYGLVASNISAFACVGNGIFVGSTWKSGELEDRLFWLEPSDGIEEAASEKTLRIAGLSRPMVLASAISDFKALHPEYIVEYIDYAELYGDQASQRLQIDLIQGNAPDLLFVNGLPFEAYANRGILENLYEWIDADDSVNRDDFTDNLMKELESADHNLYRIPQSYSIVTTAGTQAVAGSRTEWTYKAINDELANNKKILSAFYGEPRESLALTLPLYMIHTLVDYEKAESNFNSDEAISFLRFLNNVQPHIQIQYKAENEMDALRNGEIIFAQLMILSPEMFAETDDSFNGELLYLGYPDAAGGSFYLNLPMSIPTMAEEKYGAWEFMKMMFSSEYYATRGGWIPLQSGFVTSLENARANGVSEESTKKLEKIQKDICSLAYYDEMVSEILEDETSYMFAGAKTVEETAEQIDKRVQLYLTEQRG